MMLTRPRTEETASKHVLEASQQPQVATLMLGDSMFERFKRGGRNSWRKIERDVAGGVFNAGVGGDRIEHVLWRISETALLDKLPRLRRVVICAGANNLMQWKETEGMLSAMHHLLEMIKQRNASVVMLGMLPIEPLEELEPSRRDFNAGLEKLAKIAGGGFLDISDQFINSNGSRRSEFFVDDVHLNEKGYQIFAAGVTKAANMQL